MEKATPREKLLAAVVDAALAGGITDLSLRAIAGRAGTSHRMLIHHFGSREGLLVEVIRAVEERQRTVLRTLSATMDPETDPEMDPEMTAEAGQAENADASEDLGYRFWRHLRRPELAPQERLFFEIYGQALQGRPWATPLLEGIIENWVAPVAEMLEAAGTSRATARALARLSVAVGRGLLLDVLATGAEDEVDAAMRCFTDMMAGYLAGQVMN